MRNLSLAVKPNRLFETVDMLAGRGIKNLEEGAGGRCSSSIDTMCSINVITKSKGGLMAVVDILCTDDDGTRACWTICGLFFCLLGAHSS